MCSTSSGNVFGAIISYNMNVKALTSALGPAPSFAAGHVWAWLMQLAPDAKGGWTKLVPALQTPTVHGSHCKRPAKNFPAAQGLRTRRASKIQQDGRLCGSKRIGQVHPIFQQMRHESLLPKGKGKPWHHWHETSCKGD